MSLLLFFSSASVSASVDVTGVSATSALGTVSAFGTAVITVTGVSAQSAIGTVTAGVSNAVSVTGVSVASALGSVSATGTAQTTIEGVAATGAIGDTTAAGASATAPAGVSVVGATGTVAGSGSAVIAVTGVAATGVIGTATAGVPGDVSVSGVSVDAVLGTVTATGAARVAVNGLSATGAIGTATVLGAGAPPIYQPIPSAPVAAWLPLRLDGTASVTGVMAVSMVGKASASAAANVSVVGVDAHGDVGTAQASGSSIVTVRPFSVVRQQLRPDPVTVSADGTVSIKGCEATTAVGVTTATADASVAPVLRWRHLRGTIGRVTAHGQQLPVMHHVATLVTRQVDVVAQPPIVRGELTEDEILVLLLAEAA